MLEMNFLDNIPTPGALTVLCIHLDHGLSDRYFLILVVIFVNAGPF